MSGVTTRPHYDAGERTVTWDSHQDVEAILDNNKRLQNEPQKFAGHGDAKWHHIASIPNIIMLKWMNEEGVNLYAMRGEEFDKFLRKKLRDPANAWLRTTNKRV